MHEYSLEFLHCPKCSSKLDCEILENNKEIEEGFLICHNCNLQLPIVQKIPILWTDFKNYLAIRPSVGGELVQCCKHEKIRQFIKNTLSKIKVTEDQNIIEKRWTKIYQNNKKSKFYSIIAKMLRSIPGKTVLEYGCSIGLMSNFLADTKEIVFGVDQSFSAISVAKKTRRKNVDFFVANSMNNIFGKTKFDLILALNILELVEPTMFLKQIEKQTKNYLVLTDPYDYERGIRSVKKPLYENTLRNHLRELGFKINSDTKTPSNIPWNLKLNPRASLNYKVDVVIAKRK